MANQTQYLTVIVLTLKCCWMLNKDTCPLQNVTNKMPCYTWLSLDHLPDVVGSCWHCNWRNSGQNDDCPKPKL